MKIIKKAIRLNNKRLYKLRKKNLSADAIDNIIRQVIKGNIEDVFQLPLKSLSFNNFWKKSGFQIYRNASFDNE